MSASISACGHGWPALAAPDAGSGASNTSDVHGLFLAAVQAEESGEKNRAIALYEQIVERDPAYAPAFINLGTIYFHLRRFNRAEELYRRATEIDRGYVLAFFDLGNVLDELERPEESIQAYLQAVALSPRYADAHYNLALAFERRGEGRSALRHWQAYVRLDRSGPWAGPCSDADSPVCWKANSSPSRGAQIASFPRASTARCLLELARPAA